MSRKSPSGERIAYTPAEVLDDEDVGTSSNPTLCKMSDLSKKKQKHKIK